LASYGKFQSDNAKHSVKETRSAHNASFNSSVESAGEEEKTKFQNNIDKYIDLISWAR